MMYPSPDESFDRLHRAGWSVGKTGSAGAWVTTDSNGENQIHAVGKTQAEALATAAGGDSG
jgi:hypothetical protein